MWNLTGAIASIWPGWCKQWDSGARAFCATVRSSARAHGLTMVDRVAWKEALGSLCSSVASRQPTRIKHWNAVVRNMDWRLNSRLVQELRAPRSALAVHNFLQPLVTCTMKDTVRCGSDQGLAPSREHCDFQHVFAELLGKHPFCYAG